MPRACAGDERNVGGMHPDDPTRVGQKIADLSRSHAEIGYKGQVLRLALEAVSRSFPLHGAIELASEPMDLRDTSRQSSILRFPGFSAPDGASTSFRAR